MRRRPAPTTLALLLVSSSLLLGACSADEPPATSAAVSASPETTTADLTTRTVLDDVGREVVVPEYPQRVATLNEEILDAALILGVEPVGISLGRHQRTAAAYLQDRKPELTYLVNAGLPDSPDVGAVLIAEPDLVVTGDATAPDVLAGLEAIAPTFVARDDAGWPEMLRAVGVAVGREDQAETWIGGYEWRTQGARTVIAEAGNAGRSVTLALWTEHGPVVLDASSFAGGVAESVGLTVTARPATAAAPADGLPGPVTPVAELPASDWLFVFAFDALGPDGEALDAAMESAAVRALPAVAAGHVSVVDGSAWATRGGPAAAHLVLDGLLAAFGA